METRIKKAITDIQRKFGNRLYEIRQLESCNCKIRTDLFFSALHRGHDLTLYRDTNNILHEHCAYICAMCNFSNAGSRIVQDGDLNHE